MWSLARVVEFFRVVRPVPRLTRWAFAGVTAASAVRLCADADAGAEVVWPVLVLHLFAMSTGFVTYARRGHFDVLLTAGVGRVAIALVYWFLAAVPGVCGWLALAAIDLVVHQGTGLLTTGTMAAMLSVTILPWTTTVSLTRFSGAIGWLLLLVLVVSMAPAQVGRALWDLSSRDPVWLSALAFLIFPACLVGEDASRYGAAVAPALGLAAASMVVALGWIRRVDLPLDAGQ